MPDMSAVWIWSIPRSAAGSVTSSAVVVNPLPA